MKFLGWALADWILDDLRILSLSEILLMVEFIVSADVITEFVE